MSKSLVTTSNVEEGTVSRYIKPSFIEDGKILNEAFDLRDRKPPEKYVSFYLVSKNIESDTFIQAMSFLHIVPKQNGAMILLDVQEVLEEVNDEDDELITFKEKGLPHCGLIYLSNNLTKIQEIKTTLSYLATNNFKYIKQIEKHEKLN